jgi:hypothetical protein
MNEDADFCAAKRETGQLMWRAFFLAMGIATCVLGAECLVIDRFVLADDNASAANAYSPLLNAAPAATEMIPPEWAPWSLMSTGAVVILYAITINRGGP